MSIRKLTIASIVAATLLSCACSMGPRVLKGNRTDYNVSINASNNEEMLLNLVRLRYFDAPFFLNVASISSSFNYHVSAGFDVKFNSGPIEGYKGQYPYNAATPTVGAQYSENPSIIYVPLSGEKFATQLLTEISLERLLFLSRAGWDIELLFQVLVKRFGNCVNKSVAMDTALNQDLGRTACFDRLVAMLRRMQERGDLELHAKPEGAPTALVAMQMRFASREEVQEMERLLGLALPVRQLKNNGLVAKLALTQSNDLQAENACEGDTCRVFVRLRNFIGILDSLAQGVELPREGRPSVQAETPRETPVPFKVSCQSAASPAAFVSARYDGHWYSIAKNDVASRKVFSFLIQLFALEGGELPRNTPMLTLPVNR